MASAYTPTWLDPADVLHWLRANEVDAGSPDEAELNRVCALAETYVQRCRPDQWVVNPADELDQTYTPDAEVYSAGVMYAARILRRRNSPAGVESFGDLGVTFVAKWDADIERGLRVGGSQVPGVG